MRGDGADVAREDFDFAADVVALVRVRGAVEAAAAVLLQGLQAATEAAERRVSRPLTRASSDWIWLRRVTCQRAERSPPLAPQPPQLPHNTSHRARGFVQPRSTGCCRWACVAYETNPRSGPASAALAGLPADAYPLEGLWQPVGALWCERRGVGRSVHPWPLSERAHGSAGASHPALALKLAEGRVSWVVEERTAGERLWPPCDGLLAHS